MTEAWYKPGGGFPSRQGVHTSYYYTGAIHYWPLSHDFVSENFLLDARICSEMQVLAAHLAPKGVEATCLGLHAGTFNMANILSRALNDLVEDEIWRR